ncbi:Elongation factor 1-delta [Morus notabilis]|uniref:Elongation factor 1-delta n=1 Tax=Morus notabilis TaxID=981085 RepID=W9S9G6_9ROSA|nr:Elongation factor 1-delta [Morus notabilis]
MASLTPGVLSKLLANKDAKVTGNHRSALLQVIEILPSGEDPWRSRGFFLKVSDSLHSAYVAVSDSDSDMVSAGEVQIGQFVYAARLDSGSPVPVLRGLRIVPKRKSCACVGNPVELVSSDLLFAKRLPSREEMIINKKTPLLEMSRSEKCVGFDMRRLSLDSARRACWDQKNPNAIARKSNSSGFKSKQVPVSTKITIFLSRNKFLIYPAWAGGPDLKLNPTLLSEENALVISDKEASPKNIPSLKHPNLNFSPLKNKNDAVSPLLTKKPLKKELKSSSACTAPSRLLKVPLTCKTGSGQKISWDVLPPTITELGKQAVHHRNIAFLAAVRSLEEASAADGVIRCMCIFAELCESSQKSSAGAVVQKFLDLNQKMQSAAMIVDSLLNSRLLGADSTNCLPQQHLSPDACKDSASKNAALWVKAAISTNLSPFELSRKQDRDEIPNGEKCHFVVLENSPAEDYENHSPARKQNKRNNGTLLSDSSTKLSPPASGRLSSAAGRSSTEKEDSSKGGRLKEAASLAEKLFLASREWFLKYLEGSVNMGFGLRREERSPEAASLLGQLKRVNHWLDELASNGAREGKRIGGLKKKLCGFLLEHVDSAVVVKHIKESGGFSALLNIRHPATRIEFAVAVAVAVAVSVAVPVTPLQASKDDITVHTGLSKAPSAEYVNVSRWYNHIEALLRISGVAGEGSGIIVEGSASISKGAVATPPAGDSKASITAMFLASAAADEDDDDDVDLFGEETEEEKKAAEERAAAVKATGKKKESGKSSVLLDVKPWDDETDMKKLEEAVRSVQMEELHWGASKLAPVGYGIKKLQIMLTIVDDLVSVDNLIEEHLLQEPINEHVQSCDIVAFNKICKSLCHFSFCFITKIHVCC